MTALTLEDEMSYEVDEDEIEVLQCDACGGPLGLLGNLGKLTWYRCRNCGLDQSIEHTEDE